MRAWAALFVFVFVIAVPSSGCKNREACKQFDTMWSRHAATWQALQREPQDWPAVARDAHVLSDAVNEYFARLDPNRRPLRSEVSDLGIGLSVMASSADMVVQGNERAKDVYRIQQKKTVGESMPALDRACGR